ncbi:hypothetical protein GRZ59_07785 [Lactobacillus paracasei]|uniref:hypothetical protein n=1 Tax=Lacticaseibacillus paracasei TaxID=1597 RepID=UPI00136EBC78|nr:hypothetical protein [Lacticaseibacillus paracasei]MXI83641.1 hypothetical protein [Lacticaseibacillus paracasei]
MKNTIKYIGVLFIGTISVYIIILIGAYLLPNDLKVGNVGDWIAFGGSIIGSLVTIVTVLDAFKQNEADKHNDLIVRNQPYIHVFPRMDLQEIPLKQLRFPGTEPRNHQIIFDLQNVTNNSANNLKLKNQSLYISSGGTEVCLHPQNTSRPIQFFAVNPGNDRIFPGFIAPRAQETFLSQLWINDLVFIRKNGSLQIKYVLDFEFTDILALQHYEEQCTFFFNLNATNTDDFSLFLNDSTERINVKNIPPEKIRV